VLTSSLLLLRMWLRDRSRRAEEAPLVDYKRGVAFDQAAARKRRMGMEQAMARRVEITNDAVRVDRVALCRSYAWYRVVVDDAEIYWTIWKRFSDFSKLRKRLYSEGLLATEYHDWIPPTLPPKSFLRYSDRKFLEDRRQALGSFLSRLLQHPQIRRSSCMTSFLHEDHSPSDKRFIAATTQSPPRSTPAASTTAPTPRSSAPVSPLDHLSPAEKQRVCRENLDSQLTMLRGISESSPNATDARVREVCDRFRQPQLEGTWQDSSNTHDFHVRGPFYMSDKLKVHAGTAVCPLVLYQLYRNEPSRLNDRIDHVAAKGKCRRIVEALRELNPAPFLFILNIQVPGHPPMSMVMIFAMPADYDRRDCSSDAVKFRNMLQTYYQDLPVHDPSNPQSPTEEGEAGLSPSDHFRNQRFKLIPRIVDGPFLVRNAVGAKPALLGQKLTQRYYRGKNYIETDVHVGSNAVANHITGISRTYSKSVTVEIAITIEGRQEAELPEKLVGVVKFTHTDIEVGEDIMADER